MLSFAHMLKHLKDLYISPILLFMFSCTSIGAQPIEAQELTFYKAAQPLAISLAAQPAMLKGLKIHADNPFKFEFVMQKQKGAGPFNAFGDLSPSEANKLIKYFLSSLTIPEKDLWVNLSPYEKNHIVPDAFGQTEMGRDLLAQDYVLKQITASLMNPGGEIGKEFWKKIYLEAAKLQKQKGAGPFNAFGDLSPSISTFNKVWIVPDKAVVYENTKAGTAYVVESKLKVMLEQDYLAMNKNMSSPNVLVGDLGHSSELDARQKRSGMTSEIIREIIIPALTHEVNEGQHFAQLRQVYNSLILATWYKKKIKDSILNQVYSNKNKIKGLVSLPDTENPEAIYKRYLTAFKKGAYNLIREEQDPITKQIVPRKYFSGGVQWNDFSQAMITTEDINNIQQDGSQSLARIEVALDIDKAEISTMPDPKNIKVNEIKLSWEGHSIDNFHEFMLAAFRHRTADLPQKPNGFPRKGKKTWPKAITGAQLKIDDMIIDLKSPQKHQFGRTVVYYLPEKKKAVYLKFLKSNDDVDNLVYEHDVMNFLNSKKAEWELKGKYPQGKIQLAQIPVNDIDLMDQQNENDVDPKIDRTAGFYRCMVYVTDLDEEGQDNYTTYLNDPDLTHEQFLKGLSINVHDRMVMARHGLFDLEIIELFHNQQKSLSRGYDWMMQVNHYDHVIRGAGRLNNITAATLYPNIRLSGPADFSEVYYIGDLLWDETFKSKADDRIQRMVDMVNEDQKQAAPFVLAGLLGDMLLSFFLMPATYLMRTNELDYQAEAQHQGTFLQKAIEIIVKEGYGNYVDGDIRDVKEAFDIDVSFLAAQLAYFMGFNYVDANGRPVLIPDELYKGAKIGQIIPGKGWNRGWDIAHETYVIPSRNMDKSKRMRSFDLGPFNGPFPIQELIRTLYILTSFMVHDGFLSKNVDAAMNVMSSIDSLEVGNLEQEIATVLERLRLFWISNDPKVELDISVLLRHGLKEGRFSDLIWFPLEDDQVYKPGHRLRIGLGTDKQLQPIFIKRAGNKVVFERRDLDTKKVLSSSVWIRNGAVWVNEESNKIETEKKEVLRQLDLFWKGKIDGVDISNILRSLVVSGTFNADFYFDIEGVQYKPPFRYSLGVGIGLAADRIWIKRYKGEIFFERIDFSRKSEGNLKAKSKWVLNDEKTAWLNEKEYLLNKFWSHDLESQAEPVLPRLWVNEIMGTTAVIYGTFNNSFYFEGKPEHGMARQAIGIETGKLSDNVYMSWKSEQIDGKKKWKIVFERFDEAGHLKNRVNWIKNDEGKWVNEFDYLYPLFWDGKVNSMSISHGLGVNAVKEGVFRQETQFYNPTYSPVGVSIGVGKGELDDDIVMTRTDEGLLFARNSNDGQKKKEMNWRVIDGVGEDGQHNSTWKKILSQESDVYQDYIKLIDRQIMELDITQMPFLDTIEGTFSRLMYFNLSNGKKFFPGKVAIGIGYRDRNNNNDQERIWVKWEGEDIIFERRVRSEEGDKVRSSATWQEQGDRWIEIKRERSKSENISTKSFNRPKKKKTPQKVMAVQDTAASLNVQSSSANTTWINRYQPWPQHTKEEIWSWLGVPEWLKRLQNPYTIGTRGKSFPASIVQIAAVSGDSLLKIDNIAKDRNIFPRIHGEFALNRWIKRVREQYGKGTIGLKVPLIEIMRGEGIWLPIEKVKQELAKNNIYEEADLAMLSDKEKDRHIRETKRMLSEIVLKPVDYDWELHAQELPKLEGRSLGLTKLNGSIRISPVTEYEYPWNVVGRAEKDWEVTIVKAGVKNGVYEITARLDQPGRESFERTFQIGKFMRTVLGTKTQIGTTMEMLDLSDRLGLVPIRQIVSNPDSWKDIAKRLPDIKGLFLGKTNIDGEIVFTLGRDLHYSFNVLGFRGKDWLAVIKDYSIKENVFELSVELSKEGHKSITRTFQMGIFTKEAINSKNKTSIKVLRISDRLGLEGVIDLINKPEGFNWQEHAHELPDLKGMNLGITTKDGSIRFGEDNYKYAWHVIEGVQDNEGWMASVKEAQVREGVYEIKIVLNKSGEEEIERVFQLGYSRRTINKTRSKTEEKKEVFYLSDRMGLDEIIRMMTGAKENWSKEELARLDGLLIGVTNTNGQIQFSVGDRCFYQWRILGSKESGWTARISKVKQLREKIVLVVRFSKEGRKDITRAFAIDPQYKKAIESKFIEGKSVTVTEIKAIERKPRFMRLRRVILFDFIHTVREKGSLSDIRSELNRNINAYVSQRVRMTSNGDGHIIIENFARTKRFEFRGLQKQMTYTVIPVLEADGRLHVYFVNDSNFVYGYDTRMESVRVSGSTEISDFPLKAADLGIVRSRFFQDDINWDFKFLDHIKKGVSLQDQIIELDPNHLEPWLKLPFLKERQANLERIRDIGVEAFSHKTQKYLDAYPKMPLDPEIFAELLAFLNSPNAQTQPLIIGGKSLMVSDDEYKVAFITIILDWTFFHLAHLDSEEKEALSKIYVTFYSNGIKTLGKHNESKHEYNMKKFNSALRANAVALEAFRKVNDIAIRWMHTEAIYRGNFSEDLFGDYAVGRGIYEHTVPIMYMEDIPEDQNLLGYTPTNLLDFLELGLTEFLPLAISKLHSDKPVLSATTEAGRFLDTLRFENVKVSPVCIDFMYYFLRSSSAQGLRQTADIIWNEFRKRVAANGGSGNKAMISGKEDKPLLVKGRLSALLADRQRSWDEKKTEVAALIGQELGETNSSGALAMSRIAGIDFKLPVLGTSGKEAAGWKVMVSNAEIINGYLELTLRISKGSTVYTKIFQASTYTQFISSKDKKAEILELSDRLGVKALADLVEKLPNHDWANDTNLPIINGLMLGKINAGGLIQFKLNKADYQYRWSALGKHEDGWSAQVIKAAVINGIYQIDIEMFKQGEKSKRRIYQLGPRTQECPGYKEEAGKTKSALMFSDAMALESIRGLIRNHEQRWTQKELNKLIGYALGYTTKHGIIGFSLKDYYYYDWYMIRDEGYRVLIKSAKVVDNGYEFILNLTKDDISIDRIFDVTANPLRVVKSTKPDLPVLQVLDASARTKIDDLSKIRKVDQPQALATNNIPRGKFIDVAADQEGIVVLAQQEGKQDRIIGLRPGARYRVFRNTRSLMKVYGLFENRDIVPADQQQIRDKYPTAQGDIYLVKGDIDGLSSSLERATVIIRSMPEKTIVLMTGVALSRSLGIDSKTLSEVLAARQIQNMSVAQYNITLLRDFLGEFNGRVLPYTHLDLARMFDISPSVVDRTVAEPQFHFIRPSTNLRGRWGKAFLGLPDTMDSYLAGKREALTALSKRLDRQEIAISKLRAANRQYIKILNFLFENIYEKGGSISFILLMLKHENNEMGIGYEHVEHVIKDLSSKGVMIIEHEGKQLTISPGLKNKKNEVMDLLKMLEARQDEGDIKDLLMERINQLISEAKDELPDETEQGARRGGIEYRIFSRIAHKGTKKLVTQDIVNEFKIQNGALSKIFGVLLQLGVIAHSLENGLSVHPAYEAYVNQIEQILQAEFFPITLGTDRFDHIKAQVDDLDAAMGAVGQKGGIDLSTAKTIDIKEDNRGSIQFKLDPAQLHALEEAQGFHAIIRTISPLTDLKNFLTSP